MRTRISGIIVGVGFSLACGTSVYAQDKELTIFWAEWDPANYLQELGNEYEKETGVKITVETTPWPDFQTKAFTEFNAKGSAYDMVVGDSQWLGAGSTGGHYVDLTDFFAEHKVTEIMAPATVKYYAEYPGNSGKYWAVPAEGDAVGSGVGHGTRGTAPEADGSGVGSSNEGTTPLSSGVGCGKQVGSGVGPEQP